MKIGFASRSILGLCFLVVVLPVCADNVLYANGPVSGLCDIQQCTVDAWAINFGFMVANSFDIGSPSTVRGFNFAVWLSPGDDLTSVDWAIGSQPGYSDFGSGTASGANLTSTFLSTNQYGFDIWTVGVAGLDVSLKSGRFWLLLENVQVDNGNPVYWDENNGPSLADNFTLEKQVDSLPSESFNIVGDAGTGTTPEPGSLYLFASSIVGVGAVVRRRLAPSRNKATRRTDKS